MCCFSFCLSQFLGKLEQYTDIPINTWETGCVSLFSAFVRGDLECLREGAGVSTPFSSPQLGSVVSLELTEKHLEPESQNLLEWPGSPGWKILFPVSSPCFLLKVSPLAVTGRSQPLTCCVVFLHYHQNGDAKHNCPPILCCRV